MENKRADVEDNMKIKGLVLLDNQQLIASQLELLTN